MKISLHIVIFVHPFKKYKSVCRFQNCFEPLKLLSSFFSHRLKKISFFFIISLSVSLWNVDLDKLSLGFIGILLLRRKGCLRSHHGSLSIIWGLSWDGRASIGIASRMLESYITRRISVEKSFNAKHQIVTNVSL